MNINFNLGQRYRYPSRRSVVFGNCGMVATASQLAAGAGMDMLKAGGNAVDAAIATAICLTVVEPVSNGIGSDAFAIIWMKDHLYGLNSSGFAPGAISADIVRGMGHTECRSAAGFPSPCRARLPHGENSPAASGAFPSGNSSNRPSDTPGTAMPFRPSLLTSGSRRGKPFPSMQKILPFPAGSIPSLMQEERRVRAKSSA